jgi:DNA-binding LacI/PurR family transcriptional regulator
MIMVTAPETPQLVEALTKINCPVVLANRYLAAFPTDVVLMDNYHGGCIATSHLVELGHKRIGHLSGPENSTASRDRLRGYLDVMRQAGLAVMDGDISYSRLLEKDGYEFGRRLLAEPRDITAVFCGNDMLASGLVRAYSEQGRSIPEDLSIVGFDDSPVAVRGAVKLTTVRQHPKDMGEAAAEMVLRRMKDPDLPHRRQVFAPELVVRDSAVAYRAR